MREFFTFPGVCAAVLTHLDEQERRKLVTLNDDAFMVVIAEVYEKVKAAQYEHLVERMTPTVRLSIPLVSCSPGVQSTSAVRKCLTDRRACSNTSLTLGTSMFAADPLCVSFPAVPISMTTLYTSPSSRGSRPTIVPL